MSTRKQRQVLTLRIERRRKDMLDCFAVKQLMHEAKIPVLDPDYQYLIDCISRTSAAWFEARAALREL